MNLPQEYVAMCRHPEIQALRPKKSIRTVAREPGTGGPDLSCDTVARGPVPRDCLAEPAQPVARGPVPRDLAEAENLWLPTREQLLALLAETLPYPETSVFRQTAEGWEYQTCLREWAADYGAYIDAHRRFVGACPEIVLLQALTATLDIGERWMV